MFEKVKVIRFMPFRLSDHDFSHNTPSQRYIRLTVISDKNLYFQMPEQIMVTDIKRRFEAFEGFNGCQRGAGKYILHKNLFQPCLCNDILSKISLTSTLCQHFPCKDLFDKDLLSKLFSKRSLVNIFVFAGEDVGKFLGRWESAWNKCRQTGALDWNLIISTKSSASHSRCSTCSVVIAKSTSTINHIPLLRCRGERGDGCFQAGLEHGLA